MTKSSRIVAVSLASLAMLISGAPAHASTTQESVLQDDPQLLGASPVQLNNRLKLLKALGVDRLRVSVFWNNIAPGKFSQTKPRFPAPGPSFPSSYPRGVWEPYDNLVLLAKHYNLGLLLTITGPAPAWATPGRQAREGLFRPNPRDFREFAKAVGLRYSGFYPVGDNFNPQPTTSPALQIGDIKVGTVQQQPKPVPRLPRVDGWSIWNEPNFPTWLSPVWLNNHPKKAGDMVAAAPHHYRKLVDAAWAGLTESGHGDDLIVIGETAPRGAKKPSQLGNAMPPAEFARELYCLKDNFKPYTGRAARQRSCPANARERHTFRARHPGLFKAKGYGHHPYSLDRLRWRKPTWKHPIKDNVPIANLRRLTNTLDRAAFYWGSQREPIPIWITEYGYQTKPPDPIAGVAPDRQGPLTSWGEYMAYRNPRVASTAQFLFVDDRPVNGCYSPIPGCWISWQSGLFTWDFKPKPFLQDYLRPIHLAGQRGRTAHLFGGYRPGPTGASILARVEHLSGGSGWRPIRNLLVTNPRGYVNVRVRVPGPGLVRILWRDPSNGSLSASRPVAVR